LQQDLLRLVDEDAAAFRAFLDARRAQGDVQSALARTNQTPLRIAQACLDVIDLSQEVEVTIHGPMLADVRAARLLAAAALRTVLDIADQNLDLVTDPREQDVLRAEIKRLRARPGH
jgi:formiminotetrahydrofolate cyclodeaminase